MLIRKGLRGNKLFLWVVNQLVPNIAENVWWSLKDAFLQLQVLIKRKIIGMV